MRYISLFSGIEAASVAWDKLGWEPVAFSEIDPYPCSILAHHYPNVPNLGDITQIDWKEVVEKYGTVDVVVGGSPCQSFSAAGGRDSLDGESRLMFEYIRACAEIHSEWIIWENVPGVLSTHDNAFAQLILELQNCGYIDLSWRVLDSQFVRVPLRDDSGAIRGWDGPVAQRRRRVFLVGHLGEGGCSAAVLFERNSLSGNTKSSGEKRKELARAAGQRVEASGFKYHAGQKAGSIGYTGEGSPTLTADHNPVIIKEQGCLAPKDNQSSVFLEPDTHNEPINSAAHGQDVLPFDTTQVTSPINGNNPQFNDPCHTLQAEAHVPAIAMTTANTGGNGSNINTDEVSYTLDRSNSNAVCIQGNMIGRDEKNGPAGDGINEEVAFTLTAADKHAVMTQYGEVAGTLTARNDSSPCPDRGQNIVCVSDSQANAAIDEELSGSLKVGGSAPYIFNSNNEDVTGPLCARDYKGIGNEYVNEGKVVGNGYVVRRLTPRECERLQAFPDDYTLLTDCDVDSVCALVCSSLKIEGEKEIAAMRRKIQKWKDEQPDGPRYKALGNSMTTSVIHWLGWRIERVNEICQKMK